MAEKMKPAIRTQIDDLGDTMTRLTALDCTAMLDTTRQEYKDEADINKLLYRFGVNNQVRQGTYGEVVDFDMNLQSALAAVDDAKTAWANLSPELRKHYPTWQQLLVAIDTGALRDKSEEPQPPVQAPPVAP